MSPGRASSTRPWPKKRSRSFWSLWGPLQSTLALLPQHALPAASPWGSVWLKGACVDPMGDVGLVLPEVGLARQVEVVRGELEGLVERGEA